MTLVLGLAACLGLWWFLRKRPALTPRLLRRAAAWGALGLAAMFLLRGQIGLALVLGLGGAWLLEGAEGLGRQVRRRFGDRLEAYLHGRQAARRVDAEADRDPRPGRPPQPGTLTEEEAYQILGLQRGATGEEIRAAHRALMKSAHPDQGGSAATAARINAARDRLTNRHR